MWCCYVRRASGFRGVIGMSLIERKDHGKTRMRGRKKNFKCYTYMFMHVFLFAYLPNSLNTFAANVVQRTQHIFMFSTIAFRCS